MSIAYVLMLAATVLWLTARRTGTRSFRQATLVAAAAAWLGLSISLAARGIVAGRWPLTNRYEFAWWLVWVVLASCLWLEGRGLMAGRNGSEAPALPGALLAIALLAGTYAVLRPAPEKAAWPLLPALRSIWLPLHVLAAATGYGACAVAAGAAALRLRRRVVTVGTMDGAALEMDAAIEGALRFGFPCLTLALLTGAVWAKDAWGSYWNWDPKESWALVSWLWYLLILHLRGSSTWRGRRTALLALGGFAVVIFTFAGLPWLLTVVRLDSVHGF